MSLRMPGGVSPCHTDEGIYQRVRRKSKNAMNSDSLVSSNISIHAAEGLQVVNCDDACVQPMTCKHSPAQWLTRTAACHSWDPREKCQQQHASPNPTFSSMSMICM